jgi:uncharacterized phiE125 gp8 family phage protein
MGQYRIISSGPEPMSLEAAKGNLRITHGLEDDNINQMIGAARDYCERTLGWDLRQNVIEEAFTEAPVLDEVVLSKYPIQSIDKITYYDSAGLAQDFDVANVTFDIYTPRLPGMYLLPGNEWPTDVSETIRYPFIVEYTAGAALVPGSITTAMHLIIGRLFERREDEVMSVPRSVTQFLSKYKEYTF